MFVMTGKEIDHMVSEWAYKVNGSMTVQALPLFWRDSSNEWLFLVFDNLMYIDTQTINQYER
jgi:hypothetical protein